MYDAAGRVESVVDARNNRTTYLYDGDGRQTGVVNALNERTTTGYDAAGNVFTVDDGRGNRTTYLYDDANRRTVTVDALNGRETVAYDALGNVINTYDALNNRTTYVYDDLNRRTEGIDALSGRETTVYDAASQVTAVVDQLGNRTSFLYDADGRQTVTIDALGNRTTSTFDAVGNLTEQTDALGNTWKTIYDALNRAIRQEDPLGNASSTVYDAVGNVTVSIDARGNRTTSTYDVVNRRTVVQDAASGLTTTGYDAVGNAVTVTNARNYTTTIAYDALNRTSAVTDALSHTTTTIYDAAGNVQVTVDAESNRTTYGYDALNRQNTMTKPSGGVWTTVYDAAGNVVNTIDPLSNKMTFVYDELNRQKKVIDANGDTTTYLYDAASNRTGIIDASNNRSTFVYDARNQQVAQIDALGNRSTTIYDALGRAVAQVDPLGNTTHQYYDAAGRMIETADAYLYRTKYEHDAAGNVTATIDQIGARTTYTFDADNRQVTMTKPSGAVETTVYDAVGNVINTIDGLGHRNTYVYDALNRQTQSIDALSGTTTSIYDAVGNQTGLIDSVGNRTTWVYNALSQVTTETDANNHSATYAYDAAGRLSSTTDRLGRRIDYAYDAVGQRLTEKWYAVGGALSQTQTFTYDAVGNTLTAQDPDGNYTFTYDALNRVRTVAEPFSLSMTFSYDANSNRTVVEDSKGGRATTTYDADNRTTRRQFTGNGATLTYDYTYTARSEVATLKRYSDLGTTVVFETDTTYDTTGRTSNIKHYNGSNTLFSNTTYAYDAADRLTTETENGSTKTYAYDNTDQLTGDGTTTVTYDANGNRNNGSYTVGTGNQITNDGTWTYTYDNAGAMTKKSKGASLETWTFEYDHDFHVTRIEKRSSDGGTLQQRIDFTYDAFGNALTRIEYDGSLNVVSSARYGYDGWKTDSGQSSFVGQENWDVWADLDGSNNLVNRRLFGISIDSPVARVSSAGTISYYALDYHNSVRNLLDSGGTVQATLVYDSFGKITSNSNPTYTDAYGYTSLLHEASDTLRNRDRLRNLLTSYFTTPDRIGYAGDPSNGYRYAGNGPTNATDPSGFEERDNRAKIAAAYAQNAQNMRMYGGDRYTGPDPQQVYNEVMSGSNRLGIDNYKPNPLYSDRLARIFYGDKFISKKADIETDPWVDHGLVAVLNLMIQRHGREASALLARATVIGFKIEYAKHSQDRVRVNRSAKVIEIHEFLRGRITTYLSDYPISTSEAAEALFDRLKETFSSNSVGEFWGGGVIKANIRGGMTLQQIQEIDPNFADDVLDRAKNAEIQGSYDWDTFKEAITDLAVGAATSFAVGVVAERVAAKILTDRCLIWCFPAGTLVDTLSGKKPIEQVRARDRVWSFDLRECRWVLREVLRTFERDYAGEMYAIHAGDDVIECTKNHPFWVARGQDLEARPRVRDLLIQEAEAALEGRWVDSQHLQIGDVLILRSGAEQTVTDISCRTAAEKVYNLQVEDLQNYAVGATGVLAHNQCKTNLNSNHAVGNFGVYEIKVNGQLYKIGKADLDRITQSSGLPTRIHQQVRKLEEIFGKGNVTPEVIQRLQQITTAEAKAAEAARLQAVFQQTGKVPIGNQSSFSPK